MEISLNFPPPFFASKGTRSHGWGAKKLVTHFPVMDLEAAGQGREFPLSTESTEFPQAPSPARWIKVHAKPKPNRQVPTKVCVIDLTQYRHVSLSLRATDLPSIPSPPSHLPSPLAGDGDSPRPTAFTELVFEGFHGPSSASDTHVLGRFETRAEAEAALHRVLGQINPAWGAWIKVGAAFLVGAWLLSSAGSWVFGGRSVNMAAGWSGGNVAGQSPAIDMAAQEAQIQRALQQAAAQMILPPNQSNPANAMNAGRSGAAMDQVLAQIQKQAATLSSGSDNAAPSISSATAPAMGTGSSQAMEDALKAATEAAK